MPGSIGEESSCSPGLEKTVERVSIVLNVLITWVGSIKRQGHVVQVELVTWDEWKGKGRVGVLVSETSIPAGLILKTLESSLFSRRSLVLWALSIAESGDFVHVKPKTIEWKLSVEILESLVPYCGDFVVEPIEEHGAFWPDLHNGSSSILSIWVNERFDEKIILLGINVILIS